MIPNEAEMRSVTNDARTWARIRPYSTAGSSRSVAASEADVIFPHLRLRASLDRTDPASNAPPPGGPPERESIGLARAQNWPIPAAGGRRLRPMRDRKSVV